MYFTNCNILIRLVSHLRNCFVERRVLITEFLKMYNEYDCGLEQIKSLELSHDMTYPWHLLRKFFFWGLCRFRYCVTNVHHPTNAVTNHLAKITSGKIRHISWAFDKNLDYIPDKDLLLVPIWPVQHRVEIPFQTRSGRFGHFGPGRKTAAHNIGYTIKTALSFLSEPIGGKCQVIPVWFSLVYKPRVKCPCFHRRYLSPRLCQPTGGINFFCSP